MIKSILMALIPFYGDGYRFRILLRLREYCRVKDLTVVSICIKNHILHKYGCEFAVGAKISPKAMFMHTTGVVIGEGSVIRGGVKIYSGVVIGRKEVDNPEDYPIIEENAVIGTDAKILGRICIKEHTVIGANAVVLTDTDGGTWVGIPARRIK